MKYHALLTAALTLGAGLGACAQAPPQASVATPGNLFPRGERAPAQYFTGTVYLYALVKDDPTFTCVSSSVTFEPGARSNWHTHAAGQILMVTNGVAYY